MQNTQHSFKLSGDRLELASIIDHLRQLGVSMFAAISPNINGMNKTNWIKTKQIFRSSFHQVHLSASSSDISLEREYFDTNLIGDTAILTFGLWTSKVSQFSLDSSGNGSFTTTTIQGKGNKSLTIISAYIAVQKGSNIGVDSVYAQQVTLHEKQACKDNSIPSKCFCPRTDTIWRLDTVIQELQQQNHAIILMIDANQSYFECSSARGIKPFSIKWLHLQCRMDDPFISLVGRWPNSTTQTPNRDIDFILSYGIKVKNISTLTPNIPAHSGHLGVVVDIDINSYFQSSYSDIYSNLPLLWPQAMVILWNFRWNMLVTNSPFTNYLNAYNYFLTV
jgi:hypothetical protein